MHHIHTDEDITVTYKRDGKYDEAALEKLNWFLRDWRRGEEIRMDPHLIDLVWEVRRETGSKEPIWVVCGYRSPQTNAMLRRRSSGVARFSQHMLGHALDFYIPGTPLEELRVIGLRLQRGGVGFYPTSGSPFVHMDTGGIRMWPRMTREQLVRVFPDGRTVYIPTDGRPLKGYALALADLRKRGNNLSATSIEAARDAGVDVSTVLASNERPRVNPFAKFFGLANDEEDKDTAASAPSTSPEPAAPAAPATPAAPAARMQPQPALLAALERKAKEKAESARAAAAAAAPQSKDGPAKVAAATTPKLIHTATFAPPVAGEARSSASRRPDAFASRVAALMPNQVVIARGYWEGLPDGVTAAQPAAQAANALSAPARPRRAEVASADADATGSIGPWLSARDRVPAELALAYAEQPEHETPSPASPAAPMGGLPARAAADQARLRPPPYGTTIAVKRAADQAASTILTAPAQQSSAAAPGAHFDNPWLRAVVVSPSVRRFLTAVALGAQDFRSLAPLMRKPASSVMMTFSADPDPGLAHDHFSGSAIVFVSTVSYSMHTASLR